MMFALSPRYLLQVNDFINYSVNRGNNAVMRIGPKADQSKASSVSTVSAVSMSHHAIDGSPTSRETKVKVGFEPERN